jgi:hypothetical protein
MPPEDIETQVQRVTRSLKRQEVAALPDDVIERTVRACFAEREDAKIRDFVGLLAERAAREQLRRLASEAAGRDRGTG